MTPPLQILIAEDNPADAWLVVRTLRQAGFEFNHRIVDREDAYLAALEDRVDIILSDYEMPQFGGIRALELLRERQQETPFIIVSGTIGEDLAVAAMKEGAADYLLKDRLARLPLAVSQAIQLGRQHREQRTAVAALRESEERFRQVVENIGEVFWMTDVPKTEYLFLSASYEKVWGRTCASLQAAPGSWLEAVHPDDRERVALAARTKQLEGSYAEEYRIIRGDGTIAWISDRAFPVRAADGTVYRIAGIASDITERKRAAQQVSDQAAMLNLTRDAILMRGFYDRRITFWSKGAETLYGWSVAEALGRDVGELICVDPAAPDTIRDALLLHEEWRGETRHRTKAGRNLIINTRGTLVRNAAGEPAAVISINSDITEQSELEARLLRAQRMESIGTLASGVAHDLNNILAPIMMSVPLLRRELRPEQRESIISSIETSAARGAEIVRQVLTFGRGLETERGPVQIASVVGEIVKIIRETFPKDIIVECQVAPDLALVFGDATQLHQVLLNLCVNARDAMPAGGKLFLQVRNLHLDESYASMLPGSQAGPNVLLEVRDTGSGIPREIQERIFDPFFTTKGVGKGTGLGLSTVLGIVHSHHGYIGVTSEEGAGTSFQVYLPAARDQDLGLPAPAVAGPPRGGGECILVVDDEEEVRRATQLALSAHGYQVLLAGDGVEALAVFAQNAAQIALVLTDLMMPYMDGMALIHALRKMAPQVPIVASSGLGRTAQQTELQRLGVATLLSKPYGADTLLECLHQALHGTSPPSP